MPLDRRDQHPGRSFVAVVPPLLVVQGTAAPHAPSMSPALTVTEQGAYLDGIDGPQAPSLRKEGVAEMLDNLTGYLAAQARR